MNLPTNTPNTMTTNPLKSAVAFAVAMLFLAASPAVAQDANHAHHHHGDSCPHMSDDGECTMKSDDARECPMMAEGASMEDCPMMRDRAEGHDHSAHAGSDSEALSVRAAAVVDDVQVVEISVGPGGYEPSEIELQAGVTTHLVFTRTADGGCVGQVQIPDLGVDKTELPLGEAVTIEVTPTEAGTFRFACGMDMVRGTILVRE